MQRTASQRACHFLRLCHPSCTCVARWIALAIADLVSRWMIPAHTEANPTRNLFVNAHFRIEPCASCPIAGYLIVSPRIRVSSLAELSPDAQEALGPTLAVATRAIETVVHPLRVYCALFAEETRSVHFHLFPRTDWLLSAYSRAHPEDTELSGPRLFDWVRSTFREPAHGYDKTTAAIFRVLEQIT
jgi:diadenosine tetraphosphate (Ap4A) HIT family hydrolase